MGNKKEGMKRQTTHVSVEPGEMNHSGELPRTASMRTNGLKPATINHYLHGVGHNSFLNRFN